MKTLIQLLAIALVIPAVAGAQGRGDPRRGQQQPPPPPPQRGQQPPPQQQPQVRPVPPPVGGGFIPRQGPPPYRGRPQAPPRGVAPSQPAIDPRWQDRPDHPPVPHVHTDNTWIGHNTGRYDPNYRLVQPWPQGRFSLQIGPQHIWRLRGGTPDRFDIGGYYFQIAPYDIGRCRDWLWDSDDIVIYNDPDHIGWYLAYNVRLGTYCHAQYIG